MVEPDLNYEQIRLKRLEENKKRMEELNLIKLAQVLRSSSPKPSTTKQGKPRMMRQPVDSSAVRRSSRMANKPAPDYREFGQEPLDRPRRSYQRRDLLNRKYASDDERVYAIDRAEKLQSSLEPEFPSFIKPMLHSHVTGGFWLGLPLQFCKIHLPKHDEIITLIDEEGDEFQTKYLTEKNGLSGGWRGFSIDHGLVDGDALVFQLITPTRFKVYIIRVYDVDNDGEDNDLCINGDDKENKIKPNGNKKKKKKELRGSNAKRRRGMK